MNESVSKQARQNNLLEKLPYLKEIKDARLCYVKQIQQILDETNRMHDHFEKIDNQSLAYLVNYNTIATTLYSQLATCINDFGAESFESAEFVKIAIKIAQNKKLKKDKSVNLDNFSYHMKLRQFIKVGVVEYNFAKLIEYVLDAHEINIYATQILINV